MCCPDPGHAMRPNPAIARLFLLTLLAFPATARAENPCKAPQYLELSGQNPDSLSARQFANLLKLKAACEEYESNRAEEVKKALNATQGSDAFIWGAILGAVVVLFISAFRF